MRCRAYGCPGPSRSARAASRRNSSSTSPRIFSSVGGQPFGLTRPSMLDRLDPPALVRRLVDGEAELQRAGRDRGVEIGRLAREQPVDERGRGPAERSVVRRVDLGERRLATVLFVEHDRREPQVQFAAEARHPDEPARALDLEELVGAVVVAADVHVGRVRHLHHPEEVVAVVLEQRDRRRLEEQRSRANDRLHAADVGVDEPQRHRVLVHDVVEEMTARALRVEPPRVAGRIEVGLEPRLGAPDDGLDAHDGRRSDRAFADEVARLAQRRVVATVLGDAEHPVGFLRGRHHPAGVADVVRDRLLTRHVLARPQRGDRVLRVQRRGAEDLDRVDLVVGEQRVDVGVARARHPTRPCAARAPRAADRTPPRRRTARARDSPARSTWRCCRFRRFPCALGQWPSRTLAHDCGKCARRRRPRTYRWRMQIAPTDRTKVRRLPKRANYDRDLIDGIIDEALSCHVGFAIDGRPWVIPTIHARIDDRLYLHGAVANHMLRSLAGGIEACVTITLIDGLVLARSAFHHSMNYRSVMVFGRAVSVDDADEKRRGVARAGRARRAGPHGRRPPAVGDGAAHHDGAAPPDRRSVGQGAHRRSRRRRGRHGAGRSGPDSSRCRRRTERRSRSPTRSPTVPDYVTGYRRP